MTSRRTVEPLTPRQKEVLDLLADGRTNPEIAERLGISLDGAKWHVREVLARLDVSSREEAGEYWRREHSGWRRLAWTLPSLTGAGLKVGLTAAIVLGVGVITAGFALFRDGGGAEPIPVAMSTPAATATPTAVVDEFAPRSDIPVVDKVIAIVKAGDLPAFRALMKEFPEPCTTSVRGSDSPPSCPPGAAEGSLVNTFRAFASERPNTAVDLDQFLASAVPNLSTLHGVAMAQPDRFGGFFPPWKYEVIAYGTIGARQVWGEYLLDDTGIVGIWVPGGGLDVSERAKAVSDADWFIAPIGIPVFFGVPGLFVLGRDSEVRLPVKLPPACTGRAFGIRLFGYPPPGVPGGIQDIGEPGLDVTVRGVASATGTTTVAFPLPATASTPMRVRPGLLSSCLSGIAVQGGFDLALLAPPADADISIIEFSGKSLDLLRGDGMTVGENLKSLTATVSGVECQTISTSDPTVRNVRGNVEFRLGTSDQPPGCRAPGQPVSFIMDAPNTDSLAGKRLAEKPAYVPGAIQLMENFGPEPPH